MATSVKLLAKRSRAGARRKNKLELSRYVAEPSTAVALATILHATETTARATAWTRFETVGWDEV